MWTPPADEAVQDTGWKPPEDEAIERPGIGATVMDAARSIAPRVAQGAQYVLNPESALVDSVKWAANNPRQAYDAFGKWMPAAGGTLGLGFGGVGAPIGFGLGEMGRQAFGLAVGDPAMQRMVPAGQNFSPAAGIETAKQAALGGISEVSGLAKAVPGAKPYAERAIKYGAEKLAPYATRAGSAMSDVAEAATGVRAAKFKQLWNDPLAALPEWMGGAKSIKDAGTGFEAALGETGLTKRSFNPSSRGKQQANDIVDASWEKFDAQRNAVPPTTLPEVDLAAAAQSEKPVAVYIGQDDFGADGAKRSLFDIYQKGQKLGQRPTLPHDQLPEGIQIIGRRPGIAAPEGIAPSGPSPITPQEAFDTKRAVNYTFPQAVTERNHEQIRNLTQLKHGMDDILENQSGPLLAASKDYARANLGSVFHNVFRQTKQGHTSAVPFILSLASPGEIGKAALQAPLMSPIVWGAATSVGAGAAKAAAFAVSNPTTRQSLISRWVAGKSGGSK